MRYFINSIALIAIGIYRMIGTNHFGGCCRFEPSCSEYALDCYKKFGPVEATGLVFKRVINCRPGGPFGYDPVPTGKGNTRGAK